MYGGPRLCPEMQEWRLGALKTKLELKSERGGRWRHGYLLKIWSPRGEGRGAAVLGPKRQEAFEGCCQLVDGPRRQGNEIRLDVVMQAGRQDQDVIMSWFLESW